MTSILAFEKKIEALLKYSTPIGHLNHAVLFFGRFCTINLLIALHSDDMREFKCDVITVGCVQLCNNRFNPLSHIRFFNMQIILLTFPRLAFLFFAQFSEARAKEKHDEENKLFIEKKKQFETELKLIEEKEKTDEKSLLLKPETPKEPKKLKTKKYTVTVGAKANTGAKAETIWTREIARFYVAHLFMQLGMELLFMFFLHWLQRFQHNMEYNYFFGSLMSKPESRPDLPTVNVWYVPQEYDCYASNFPGYACKNRPEDNIIPCFVPRSYDKTIFMWYHIVMSIVSMLFITWDIIYSVRHNIKKKVAKRTLRQAEKNEAKQINNGSFSSLKR